eukprot:COSAG05_NODE_97_length_19444_cov_8.577174_7_plen_104_part_00
MAQGDFKRKHCNFQVDVDEPKGTGKKMEASIGHLTGTVLGATGLKQSKKAQKAMAKGVKMAERVEFEEKEELLLQGIDPEVRRHHHTLRTPIVQHTAIDKLAS